MQALQRIYVIDYIPAWNPSIRSKTSIRSSNKKLFVDPSIAASVLGSSPVMLEQDMKTFGFLFENLCIRDLRVYSSVLGGNISYYRDRFGSEADAALHLDDGKYELIEIKLGPGNIDAGVKHLLKLEDLIMKSNDKDNSIKLREPDLLLVITGNGLAYTRKDGVKIIPISCLKD